MEAGVRRAERPLPLPVQRQEGRASTRQLPSGGRAPADQHQVLPHRHLLQRHETQERAEADHVRLRVPVPGRGSRGHAGLDPGDPGQRQPG